MIPVVRAITGWVYVSADQPPEMRRATVLLECVATDEEAASFESEAARAGLSVEEWLSSEDR